MERRHWSLLVIFVLAAIPLNAQEKSADDDSKASQGVVSQSPSSKQTRTRQADFINDTYENMLAAQAAQGIVDPIRLAAAVQHPSREVHLKGKENRELNHPPSRLVINRQPPTRTRRRSASQRGAFEPSVLHSSSGPPLALRQSQQGKRAEFPSNAPSGGVGLEIQKELEDAYDALLETPESKSWTDKNRSLADQKPLEAGTPNHSLTQGIEASQTEAIMSVAGVVEQLARAPEPSEMGAKEIQSDMEAVEVTRGISSAAFVIDEGFAAQDAPPVPALPVSTARELPSKHFPIAALVDQPVVTDDVVSPPVLAAEQKSFFTQPSPEQLTVDVQESETAPKEPPVAASAQERVPFVPPIVNPLVDSTGCDQPVCDLPVCDSVGGGSNSLFSSAGDRKKSRGFELVFDLSLGNRDGRAKPRAADCGWYGLRCPEVYYSVFGGATSVSNFVETILLGDNGGDGDVGIQPVFETDVDYAFEDAFAVGVAVGQIHGRHLRTELEMSFRNNNAETLSITQLGETEVYDLDGELRSFSGMGNAYWEFVDFPMLRVKPYVGAGVGFSLLESDLAWNGFRLLDDSYGTDSAFAYQGMAGVNVCTGPRMSLFVEYRYFATDSIRYKAGGLSNEFRVKTDNVFVGLRFKF